MDGGLLALMNKFPPKQIIEIRLINHVHISVILSQWKDQDSAGVTSC